MYPRGRELVDADGVRARYGVRHPASMRDLQALMGDAVVGACAARVAALYCGAGTEGAW